MKKTFNLGDVTLTIDVTENRSQCATPSFSKPQPCGCSAPNREPDGFDAHIDRPQRSMYGGWDAEYGYQKDLALYRKAEAAVKACNWPCREPMGNTPCWPVPQTAPKAVKTPTRDAWGRFTSPCSCQSQPRVEVRQKCGIPPIGAKVVAHRWGEPVFDR